jgi:hypothetical protein
MCGGSIWGEVHVVVLLWSLYMVVSDGMGEGGNYKELQGWVEDGIDFRFNTIKWVT